MSELTDRSIQAAKATSGKHEWLSDGGARGAGRLYLRVTPSGSKHWYFRYADATGRRDALALGEYAARPGSAGLTLAQARKRAGELADMYRRGIKDLKAHFEAERKEVERQRHAQELSEAQAAEEARRLLEEAQRGTLACLLDAYVAHLERSGKIDYADARNIFKLHVKEAFPDLAEKKANTIKPMEMRAVLARLIESGKGRTAGKLRSYLRAAYSAAARADLDPAAPSSLLGFGIETNPCANLPTLAQHNRAGERTLTEEEFKYVLNGLQHFNPMMGLVIECAVLLGGQRPTQLLRVEREDVTLTEHEGEIRLRDPKGRRHHPRLHVLPLTGRARELVERALMLSSSDSLVFSARGGKPISESNLSAVVREIAQALVESGRSHSMFRLGDLRRTAETMLAGLGINSDIRAQLLSHGLGGVQQRNYDKHNYMAEKAAALARWEQHLDAIRSGRSTKTNVIPLANRAA